MTLSQRLTHETLGWSQKAGASLKRTQNLKRERDGEKINKMSKNTKTEPCTPTQTPAGQWDPRRCAFHRDLNNWKPFPNPRQSTVVEAKQPFHSGQTEAAVVWQPIRRGSLSFSVSFLASKERSCPPGLGVCTGSCVYGPSLQLSLPGQAHRTPDMQRTCVPRLVGMWVWGL